MLKQLKKTYTQYKNWCEKSDNKCFVNAEVRKERAIQKTNEYIEANQKNLGIYIVYCPGIDGIHYKAESHYTDQFNIVLNEKGYVQYYCWACMNAAICESFMGNGKPLSIRTLNCQVKLPSRELSSSAPVAQW